MYSVYAARLIPPFEPIDEPFELAHFSEQFIILIVSRAAYLHQPSFHSINRALLDFFPYVEIVVLVQCALFGTAAVHDSLVEPLNSQFLATECVSL